MNASDDSGDTLTYGIEYDLLTIDPATITINTNTGLFDFTPAAADTYLINFTVNDGINTVREQTQILVQ